MSTWYHFIDRLVSVPSLCMAVMAVFSAREQATRLPIQYSASFLKLRFNEPTPVSKTKNFSASPRPRAGWP